MEYHGSWKEHGTLEPLRQEDVLVGEDIVTSINNENVIKTRSIYLYISAVIANIIVFACGIAFSWTSPVIPKLNGKIDPEDNPFSQPITQTEESWIAGLLSLGCAIGPIFVGKLPDKIGRKRTLIVLDIIIFVSYMITAFAEVVPLLYFARFLSGIGVGHVFAILSIYMVEMSESHNRGTVGCLMPIFGVSGVLFPYLVGPYLTVKVFTLICNVPVVLFLILFTLFVPDSPVYLVSIGNTEGATKTLEKLRGVTGSEIERELIEINKTIEEIQYPTDGIFYLFKSPVLRRCLNVSMGLVVLQQFCGINAILSYLQSIFDATGSSIPPEIASIIVGSVQVITTIVTSIIVEKFRRKTLIITSLSGCCISIVVLSIYFYLKNNGHDTSSVFWLPVSSLMAYIFSYNLGLGTLPWTVIGEILPVNVKSVVITWASSVGFVASFLITLVFPYMTDFLGMTASFLIFAVFCVLGSIYTYFIVPETKGKTMLEIQQMLVNEENTHNI